jgi:hypothetical protein
MDMSLSAGAFSAMSSVIGAYYGNKVEEIKANAANTIRAGNNEVTAGVNARNASVTALQRWRQGVANSRVYEAVAQNQEALATNFNRARDQRTRQDFATNIRGAEESGRQQAAAAASGISGSVVDVIDMTSNLRRGMERQATVEAENQMVSDFDKQELRTRLAGLDALDFTAIYDNQQIRDTTVTAKKSTNLLGAAISGKDTLKNISNGLASFKFNTNDSVSDVNGSDLQSDQYIP